MNADGRGDCAKVAEAKPMNSNAKKMWCALVIIMRKIDIFLSDAVAWRRKDPEIQWAMKKKWP